MAASTPQPVTVRLARSGDYPRLAAVFAEAERFHREALPHVFRQPRGLFPPRSLFRQLLDGPDSGGTVYLSGSLHQPSGTSELSAILPAAARPAHATSLDVYTYDGTKGVVVIEPDGAMYTYLGGTQQYTSLAGISFPAAKDTVHKLALDNGWQSGEATFGNGDPSYWVSGGVVHLSGSMLQPSGTDDIFAVLPKADRPAHDLYIQVMVWSPDENVYAGTVLIEPNGTMQAYGAAPGDAQRFTSLAGISYPLGS